MPQKAKSKLSRLPEKYPILFKCKYMDGSIHPFEAIGVGEGWYKILDKFARKATPIIKRYSEKDRPYLSTIKEKYATLRICFNHSSDELEELVCQAETESETTCETCGGPGKVRGKSWYYTACLKHTKEHDK